MAKGQTHKQVGDGKSQTVTLIFFFLHTKQLPGTKDRTCGQSTHFLFPFDVTCHVTYSVGIVLETGLKALKSLAHSTSNICGYTPQGI